MLKGQSHTSQTAERSRVLFQNGIGFDIEFVLKHDPTHAFFTDTHTQRHTVLHKMVYLQDSRCARGQFCAIYSGLFHAVMKHLSSLPYPLLLVRSENENSFGRNTDDGAHHCGCPTVTSCI